MESSCVPFTHTTNFFFFWIGLGRNEQFKNKSDRERQIPYDFTHVESKKQNTDTNKADTNSKAQRTKLVTVR